MIKLGTYNRLTVERVVEIGLYLDGGERWGDILLPNASAAAGVKEHAQEGDELEVFIYFDSEDRIIATMERPVAVVGDFALMKVAGTSRVGAFLEWGLRKDLLVPFREQREPMVVGREYLVHVYVDETTDRIVASARWGRFLNRQPVTYAPGEEVELIVAEATDLGFRVIVNKAHEAMIYRDEVFRPLRVGDQVTGYIKRVREDGKIDCSLQRNDGAHEIERVAQRMLERLEERGGRLKVSDKSAPEEIHALFGCSKKNYKKAAGALFRRGVIYIADDEIKLV
ncbi:MAG: GntR family transcriptional regulator [Odoribacteraceae bacterium]|nr:GntR family transcriptional regulator [Odoribacteraceae bacterium]